MFFLDAINWFGQAIANVTEPKDDISVLNPDDQALYQKMVKDLLHCYVEGQSVIFPEIDPTSRDPLDNALIFRKSRSWKVIEQKFDLLLSLTRITKVTKEISDWVDTWKMRINELRQNQIEMRQRLIQLQGFKKNNNSAHQTSTTPSSAETRIRRLYRDNIRTIKRKLIEGQNDLEDLKPDVALHPICWFISEEIKDKWLGLTLCFERPLQVSPDDEKMLVELRRPRQLSRPDVDKLINNSTLAIFLIEEKELGEIPLEYDGIEGKIICPKKIGIKQAYLAPAPPSPGASAAAAAELTDEMIFDVPLAEVPTNQKKISSKEALHLQQLVKLALKTVNRQLTQEFEDLSG